MEESGPEVIVIDPADDVLVGDDNGPDCAFNNETSTLDNDELARLILLGEEDSEDEFHVNVDIPFSTPDGQKHYLCNKSGPTPPPTVGMVFKNWEAVETYFRSYAKQQGFGIVRAHGAYRQRNGKMTKERRTLTWKCERFGNKDTRRTENGRKVKFNTVLKSGVVLATRKSKKCQCPVSLYAGARRDGDWEIRRVVLEHYGHTPAPTKAKYISMFRHDAVNRVVRRRLYNDLEAGIKVPLIHRALAKERNGLRNTVFTQRDLRNIVDKRRRMKLAEEGGDANAMVNYLKKMHVDNDTFFHATRFDTTDRLKDVMWVDARSRAAYNEFSDVVCFDTTYITNKFKLPFANFVGVNHHGQTTLFGCALVRHEDSETFEWLFRTWLECMGGRKPAGFLTDQSAAMRKALKVVMPESRHRWCLWHILNKFSTKLGMYEKYDLFNSELNNVIYDSLTGEDFEANWCSVVKKYKLEDNEWLAGLFEEREMWVPAYMKHVFWAGMKTTQRSESINSYFDGYVQRKTLLHEFASQYFAAVEGRLDAEDQADADCERNVLQLVSDFSIEVEYQSLYTSAKFHEFQLECLKIMYVHIGEAKKLSEKLFDFTVTDRVWYRCKVSRKDLPTKNTCEYSVKLDVETNEAWCSCKLMECHEIMCCHIIKLFDVKKIRKLPMMFILDRWRKDIERPYTQVKVRYHDPSKTEEVARLDQLQLAFDSLSLIAAESEKDTAELIDVLERQMHKLEQKRADEATPSKVRQNVDDDGCRSKVGDNVNSTPPSVGNNKRPIDSCTPPSVKRTSPGAKSTPGVGESVGCVPETGTFSCDVDGMTEPSGPSPSVIKDPPLPKNPRHRPPESRLKSAAAVNSTGKGRGKIRATKKFDAKQLEICTLQLQQQQNALQSFLEKQVEQQATFQQQVQQQVQQQMTSIGWLQYNHYPVAGTSVGGAVLGGYSPGPPTTFGMSRPASYGDPCFNVLLQTQTASFQQTPPAMPPLVPRVPAPIQPPTYFSTTERPAGYITTPVVNPTLQWLGNNSGNFP